MIDEAVREIERLEKMHDSLMLAQWKPKDINNLQAKIQRQITAIKRRAGLIGSSDAGFAEFFRNWRDIGENHVHTAEQRRGHLRWMQRMLRTPVIATISNG